MMHYIKVEKNVGADAFSRMRFQNSSNSDVPPMDKLCAIADDPPCVMADLVLRAYHDEDLMIQKIKFSCLSGSNIFARYGIHHDTSGDKIIIKQSTWQQYCSTGYTNAFLTRAPHRGVWIPPIPFSLGIEQVPSRTPRISQRAVGWEYRIFFSNF